MAGAGGLEKCSHHPVPPRRRQSSNPKTNRILLRRFMRKNARRRDRKLASEHVGKKLV
jgi:hypothetical protein